MSQEGRQLFNQSYKFQCRVYFTIAGEVKHHRDATDDAGPVDEVLSREQDGPAKAGSGDREGW